jgi:chromosome segregation ATPase
VSRLSEKESDREHDSKATRESLESIVQKLEQASESSDSWDASIKSNPEKWKRLKEMIQKRQRELKQLVTAKKSGLIGADEFQKRYSVIQDELTQLEFEVYNMRLGTDVHP